MKAMLLLVGMLFVNSLSANESEDSTTRLFNEYKNCLKSEYDQASDKQTFEIEKVCLALKKSFFSKVPSDKKTEVMSALKVMLDARR